MQNSAVSIYPKNREKIKWKVPSLFNNDEVILTLSDICQEIGIRQPIHSVYGSVRCSWGGGRSSKWLSIDKPQAVEMISKHSKRGISCCFTFSNYHVSKEDLDDKIGNLLLDVASQSDAQNYAIVSSDILTDYIRKNYPNIKIISSILKPVYEIDNYQDTPEYYNNLCKTYDKVVVRPEFCFNDKLLKQLKDKNKIEIMTNLTCLKQCPLTRRHYDLYSDIENGRKTEDMDFCNKEMRNAQSVYNTSLLSSQDIDRLLKLGFTNFKLKGRNILRSQLLEMIGIYIFEPTGIYQNISRLVGLRID